MRVSKKETHWYILTLLTSILLTVEKINEHFMMIILKLKHTSRLDSVTVDYNFWLHGSPCLSVSEARNAFLLRDCAGLGAEIPAVQLGSRYCRG